MGTMAARPATTHPTASTAVRPQAPLTPTADTSARPGTIAAVTTEPVSDAERRAGTRWLRGIVAVLVGTMALNFWVLRTAGQDGGVNAEPDYYRQAVGWDAAQARAAASAALGWTADVAFAGERGTARVVHVALRDRTGAPIRDAQVTVRARWNGDATHAVQGNATATADGYAVALPLGRDGLHEVRVEAVRGADRYETLVKLDAPARTTAAR